MLVSNERCYNVQKWITTMIQKGSPFANQLQHVTSHEGNNVVTWCVDLFQHDLSVQVLICNIMHFMNSLCPLEVLELSCFLSKGPS